MGVRIGCEFARTAGARATAVRLLPLVDVPLTDRRDSCHCLARRGADVEIAIRRARVADHAMVLGAWVGRAARLDQAGLRRRHAHRITRRASRSSATRSSCSSPRIREVSRRPAPPKATLPIPHFTDSPRAILVSASSQRNVTPSSAKRKASMSAVSSISAESGVPAP